jgi:hypothetical protein
LFLCAFGEFPERIFIIWEFNKIMSRVKWKRIYKAKSFQQY